MPTPLPSFASAAAGNNSESSGRSSSRTDGSGFTEWPRRPNGATQTFRRTSTAASSTTLNQQPQREQTSNPPSTSVYVPPHITSSGRNGSALDTRYSKSQLLDLFRLQKDIGDLGDNVANLYVGDSPLDFSNGGSASRWSRKDEQKSDASAPGPDVCWERSGASEPLGLSEMTDEEREIFSTSVNSPLKAPNQAGTRDSSQREGTLNRKSSLSHNQSTGYSYGVTSPTAPRSGSRRLDTSDSLSALKDSAASPTARDESSEPSALNLFRRKTDLQDSSKERSIDSELARDATESSLPGMASPFDSFKRSVSNLGPVGSSDASSNWPPTSQAPSGMGSLGAFGNLGRTAGNLSSSGTTKRPDLGPSRESRFRGLMNIGKTEEEPTEDNQQGGSAFADIPRDASVDDPIAGLQQTTSGTPGGQRLPNELGSIQGAQSLDQQVTSTNEPLSPTFTNPYSSPPQQSHQLHDADTDDFDPGNLHLPGLGGYQSRPTRNAPSSTSFAARREMNRTTSYDQQPFERNQLFGSGTSNKGFPSLGGLGALGGFGNPEPWSSSGFGSGPSAREKSSFPDFGVQNVVSPSTMQPQAITGQQTGFSSGDPGAIGRNSKLGSLFPSGMQEQMRSEQNRNQREESSLQAGSEAEDLARASSSRRDIDSPFRHGRGRFDDFSGSTDLTQPFRGNDPSTPGDPSAAPGAQVHSRAVNYNLSQQQQYSSQHPGQRSTSISTTTSNQPPAAQQKTMVMPDRIRWIYRDPQGNTQGPWSGLEMHDWYRAGFFSPELLVKKVEDSDYEPLAQLIRRIGNSREPFLVPQIGIPGPPTTQAGPGWPNQNAISSPPTTAASVQPPFAGSFPSFGTTLTAEQQNALERRKQEEQYLMARQKEHLAQQQYHARQMQGQHGMYPQQLQHHSSAQSLQSQPSYGSMTSPNGFQASPPQNMTYMSQQMGYDSGFRHGAGAAAVGPIGSGAENLANIREEGPSALYDRYGGEPGSTPPQAGRFPVDPQFSDLSLEERTTAMLADRARLEQQQQEEQSQILSESIDNDRLREFQELQGQMEEERALQAQEQEMQQGGYFAEEATTLQAEEELPVPSQGLTLTEQVQKAASKQSPSASPWAQVDTAISEAQVPHSASPLPAPAARRGRTNVADNLVAEPISHSQSPAEETATSSVAPWAKDSSETQKQPSLREIQELEARKAAKQEEMAAAARRAALEREMANQPTTVPAPGLPSSSTWGSSESPVTPSGSSSAWSKPTAAKAVAASSTAAKKTLQQIQAEEEAAARKKKASAASNASIASHIAGQVQSMSSGKRYADLAGKTSSSPSAAAGGGAWTTVGASGKAKAPPTPSAAPTATATRSASGTNLVGAGAAATPPTQATKTKSATSSSKPSLATAKQTAIEDFKKWATAELQPDLHKNINVDEFVQTLLNFPPDTDMITEVVHQNSSTIDSRHFAEEFMRRRNLAEKGKTEGVAPTISSSTAAQQGAGSDGKGSSGGWNEVARKGGATSSASSNAEGNGAFKIVTAKKKSKR